jgi:hypothetical protein
MASRTPFVVSLSLMVGVLTHVPAARAEPLFGWGQSSFEDDASSRGTTAGRLLGANPSRGESWVTLGGFATELRDGSREVGAMLVVGLAFDRIALGDAHRTYDSPRELPTALVPGFDGDPPVPPAASQPPAVPDPELDVLRVPPRVTPTVARKAVVAAWRASGLGIDDARIDSMVARSRASALLPETRLRAMRVLNDTSKVDAIPDTTGTYLAVGANLWLEARLTWRLDRLLFANDEPTLERVRLERHDARARLATKVIDVLFAWQRALVRAESSRPESKEAVEAELSAAESEATLDVLTAGWFSGWKASLSRPPPSTGP